MKIKKIKAVAKKQEPEILDIRGEYISLDSALKLAGIAGTGGQAKLMIQSGDVKFNGEVCDKRSKKLRNGDTFQFERYLFEVRTHEG